MLKKNFLITFVVIAMVATLGLIQGCSENENPVESIAIQIDESQERWSGWDDFEFPGEGELPEGVVAKRGAAIGMAWPFGGAENPHRWVGWTGWSYGGAWGNTGCGWRFTHSGADLYARDLSRAGCTGVRVYAGFTGKVIRARNDGGYGKTVVIYDRNRHVAVRYSHLSVIGVYKGQWVSWGQYVGKVGSTGFSSGPHLHLAAYENINDNHGNPIIPSLCDSEHYTCASFFYSW